MRKGTLIPLIFGLAGVAILVSLGVWQVQRLAWKERVLSRIEARISGAPVALPRTADPREDRYLPLALEGRIGDRALRVLVSRKQIGAGYRVISAFETREGRRVLLDRGFIRTSREIPPPPDTVLQVKGNLHWPDERLGSTPENDVAGNIWFARDIAPMSEILRTEPLLVVAREVSPPEPALTPLPVDTSAIPNDHLSYAVTWFTLAAIWAAMTALFIRRGRGVGKTA